MPHNHRDYSNATQMKTWMTSTDDADHHLIQVWTWVHEHAGVGNPWTWIFKSEQAWLPTTSIGILLINEEFHE